MALSRRLLQYIRSPNTNRTDSIFSVTQDAHKGLRHPMCWVVDDDRRLADAPAIVLNQHGFDTSAVFSGAEAIQRAIKAPPDFVVMDVFMNGIDGNCTVPLRFVKHSQIAASS